MNISDYYVTCPDKTAAVDESTDAGAEMTEEEWNLRVAELNKHQVWLCNLRNPCKQQKNVMKWLISRRGQSVCQSSMLPTPHHFHLVTGPWTFTDMNRNPSACSQIPIQYNVDYSQCVPEHLESNCSASTKQFTEELVGVHFYVTVYQPYTAQRASQRISSFMTPGSKSGPVNQKLWNKEMFSKLDR